MKKRVWVCLICLAIGCLLLTGQAWAELSTNLRIVTVPDRTAQNRPATETYVDAEGNPVIPSDKGYATVRYTYYTNKPIQIKTIELLDTEGNPVNGTDGYARVERRYMSGGKELKEQRYYDAEGNPVTGPAGYARYTVNESIGNYREEWKYDPEGNPVGIHRITLYHMGKRVKSDSWYDAEDNPVAGPNGYARMESEYTNSIQSLIAYYDENGNLYYYPKAGYARMERDADTVIREERYYGTDGELMAGPNGYACVKYSYHANKHVRKMYYNADGSLYYNSKGICGVETVTDQGRKKVVEEYYFTGENQRGKNTDGISGMLRAYNKYNKMTMERFVDENDQPVVMERLGYCRVKNGYMRKHITSSEYLDAAGQPVLNADGYALVKYEYEQNSLISTTYYGTDGKTPVNLAAGYAKETYERDEQDNIIRTNWYDAEGNPCPGPNGAEEERTDWAGGNKAVVSYWTADGQPAA